MAASDGDANPDHMESLLNELEDSMDDVGHIKRQYMSKIIPDDDEFNSSQVPVDTVTKREVQDLIESIPRPMVQKPFQPGSSPNDEDKRFLCWNNVGIIRAQCGNEDQSIDVMFHDTERHSSVNFKNEPNYTFGSMSDEAIVVASNGKYNTGPASLYGVNLMETNRDQREWEINLPHVELIEGLAVGKEFVAIATDQRNLRLFTNGGMQSYIFTLPGQVVCMSAYGHRLLIIYHNGAGHSDDQNLSMFVYYIDIKGNIVRQTHTNVPVALSKRSPLAWAGFSDESTPCTYDYSGVMRIFREDLGNNWVPIHDLRELTESALDHYFVVGVSEISQVVRAVKCKRSRFPEFSQEIAELFSFSLPMCDTDTDRGKLEEEHVRLKLSELSYKRLKQNSCLAPMVEHASEVNEKLLVNNVLRLFASYLKEDKEDLAKSLAFMIPKDHTSKLPEFAWKIRRPQYFIEALNRTIEEREERDESAEVQRVDDDSISIISGKSEHSETMTAIKQANGADTTKLRPIPLDKLIRTANFNSDNNNKRPASPDHESGDENDAMQAKKTKTINYNLFSKKRPKTAN